METSSRVNEVPLCVVILTRNEERNLPECLQSLCPLSAPVFVVDSGSTDATCEIARRFGAAVLEHSFTTHAVQWAWALEHLPGRTTWVLGLDADQRLMPEAAESICQLVGSGSDVRGAFLARRQIFRGRWIRHGGYYPKYLLKLFRRDSVVVDTNDLVDHHFAVRGKTMILRGDLIEANANEDSIDAWLEKHQRYAILQAQEEFARADRGGGRMFGSPDEQTLWRKRVWGSLPLYLRPVLYFLYRYFLRMGFLDGKQGLIFHVLQGFWYRFLVDIHLDDLRRARSAIKTSVG